MDDMCTSDANIDGLIEYLKILHAHVSVICAIRISDPPIEADAMVMCG
jgi:hypothetical protein